jgi:hypothetical protein
LWLDACIVSGALIAVGVTRSFRVIGLGFLHNSTVLFALCVAFVVCLVRYQRRRETWVRFDEMFVTRRSEEWAERERQGAEKQSPQE